MNSKKLNSDDFLDYLVNIAKEDNVISTEEQNFINVVEKEITTYEDELGKFIKNGTINKTEKLTLYHSRMRIVRKALDVVMTDFEFSDDEQKLFSGLKDKLKELEDLEKGFLD